ncbi:hypothetical protein [Devosia sp. 2618]|uniref:hypothetical protein n=1 Tax=Devosia sp. 2618 TaxID=3156454 RepID=UPI003391D634
MAFQTRSRERDQTTDINRYRTLLLAVERSVDEVRKEREGLQRRLDEHLLRASSIVDNSGAFGSRDPQDEKDIEESERQIQWVRQRLGELERQSSELDGVRAQVSGLLG